MGNNHQTRSPSKLTFARRDVLDRPHSIFQTRRPRTREILARCRFRWTFTRIREPASTKSPSKVETKRKLFRVAHCNGSNLTSQSLVFSRCRQRSEVAQDADVQAFCRGVPDRASPVRQEAAAGDQDQERQLVAQVQRNFQLVSTLRLELGF